MKKHLIFWSIFGVGLILSIGLSFLILFIDEKFFTLTYPLGALIGYITLIVWHEKFNK